MTLSRGSLRPLIPSSAPRARGAPRRSVRRGGAFSPAERLRAGRGRHHAVPLQRRAVHEAPEDIAQGAARVSSWSAMAPLPPRPRRMPAATAWTRSAASTRCRQERGKGTGRPGGGGAAASTVFSEKQAACLFVKKHNRPALALYERLGFTPVNDYVISYYGL